MTDLELALRGLGERLEHESTPDLCAEVAARLDGPASPRPRRWRTFVVALAATLLAASGALAASPALRDRARDWLRAVGISTSVSDRASRAPRVGLDRAGLGRRITTAAAAARLGVSRLPEPFGPAERVFATGRTVTLMWPPARDRPPSAVRGVGALLSLSTGAGANETPLLAKLLSRTTTPAFVALRGADGGQAVWISGAPHAVTGFDGTVVRFRLAANVLVWRAGGVGYRLEGAFSHKRAITAARRAFLSRGP